METYIANNWLDSAKSYNLLNAGRTYNYYEYENETDNYAQDHFQLHFSHQFNDKLAANAALHYTYGRGYYEQFREGDDFVDYGLPDLVIGADTITSTDLIRRRWLDNDFYGATYNLKYTSDKLSIILGGGNNVYEGGHYGEMVWMEFANGSNIRDRYYDNVGEKKDFNAYLKVDYLIGEKLTVFADMQVRRIEYSTKGIDNNQSVLSTDTSFIFFNPKGGLSFKINDKVRTYASVSVGNHEPVRSDFIDNPANKQPKHEMMIDYELGVDVKLKKVLIQGNFYYMDYTNQLILTGELNDVGSSIRANVDKSYRAGFELNTSVLLSKRISVNFNTTISQNKIADFTEVVYDDVTYEAIENHYSQTDISFSPNLIGAASVVYNPIKSLNLMLQTKYVGDQFLDNTSNANRKIDAYQTVDARLSYTLFPKKLKEISFNIMANNILNTMYSSNGYTYQYLGTNNFYYPQAGINFLAGLTVKF